MTRPPFELEGIDHVVLLVRDMAEAQLFYEQVWAAPSTGRCPNMACSSFAPEPR